MTGADESARTDTSLAELFDLDRVDRDLYVGMPGPAAGPPGREHTYGGLVAAQALRAAIHTVDPERAPHSLHGYFLRPGDAAKPVVLEAYRDRDGGSFSARRVVARQEGEVIFSLAASFHIEEESGEYEPAIPSDLPDPDDVVARHSDRGGPTGQFDFRSFQPPGVDGPVVMPTRYWVRAAESLPDDPSLHVCALTYLSDLGSGFGRVDVPGLAIVGPSIDHTLWFQRPVRVDDWLLVDLWPLRASRAVGTYAGTIHARSGALAAALTQECLLRRRPETK